MLLNYFLKVSLPQTYTNIYNFVIVSSTTNIEFNNQLIMLPSIMSSTRFFYRKEIGQTDRTRERSHIQNDTNTPTHTYPQKFNFSWFLLNKRMELISFPSLIQTQFCNYKMFNVNVHRSSGLYEFFFNFHPL